MVERFGKNIRIASRGVNNRSITLKHFREPSPRSSIYMIGESEGTGISKPFLKQTYKITNFNPLIRKLKKT
jgi:hypothetical protein